MKKLILLGTFITSLATMPAAFADSETYFGSNCAINNDPGIFTLQLSIGMQVINRTGTNGNSMMCSAVNQEELDNTPKKLWYARVDGRNIKDTRLCWKYVYDGGSTYCGNPKSITGSGSIYLYPKFPSNNPKTADKHGPIWLDIQMPDNGHTTTIRSYSVKFKR